jgi:hypothetical protein
MFDPNSARNRYNSDRPRLRGDSETTAIKWRRPAKAINWGSSRRVSESQNRPQIPDIGRMCERGRLKASPRAVNLRDALQRKTILPRVPEAYRTAAKERNLARGLTF